MAAASSPPQDVVRKRFLVLTAMLCYENFDTFVRGKAVWHQELAELKETTLRKLRANLFCMLHDEGFLSDEGHLLQGRVEVTARSSSPVPSAMTRPGE
jgi:hypothetical protein